MPEVKKVDEKQGAKIEIGSNLLLAIELILNSVERENANHFLRRLQPGKQVQKALGIDMAKIRREYIKTDKQSY